MAVKEELKKHGDNIASILVNTNATPIYCQDDLGYRCCFCSEGYIKPADLKKHTLKSHDDNVKKNYIKGKQVVNYLVKLDITGLKCNICGNHMDSLDDMMHHLKDHGEKIHFDINNHIVPFKFDDDALRCIVCKLVFHKFKALLKHMSRHSKNYVCDICGLGFVNRTTFYCHYYNHNKGKFPCDYCSKVCGTQYQKKNHEALMHLGLYKCKCGICGARFDTPRQKDKHLSSVHGIPIQEAKCHTCGKTFLTQKILRLHCRRDHLQERRYACNFCSMRFFTNRMLHNHIAKHTGKKRFQCDVCPKSFHRKHSLVRHIELHATDGRFECEHCAMSFKERSSLVEHLNTKHLVMYTSVEFDDFDIIGEETDMQSEP